jgi:phosphoribosylpyrophosphate synthetase
MQILNLVHPEKGSVKYTLNGSLKNYNSNDSVCVQCRIVDGNDLYLLLQVCSILTKLEANFFIEIYYLTGSAFKSIYKSSSYKVILDAINHYKVDFIYILNPLNRGLFNYLYGDNIGALHTSDIRYSNWNDKYQLVLLTSTDYGLNSDEIICEINNGNVKVKNPKEFNGKHLLVLSDYCDSGNTLNKVSNALNECGIPKDQINVAIIHALTFKGIKKVSKSFNQVWITNSVKDWNNIPENVYLNKVI